MKGFTLPTSNTTSNGSFYYLITQTSANANTIVQAPLMFVRGGNVNPGHYLNDAGISGNYWSSVGRSSSGAYSLGFYSGGVYPSNTAWASIQAASTPRTSAAGTSVSLSAVSPSAARRVGFRLRSQKGIPESES